MRAPSLFGLPLLLAACVAPRSGDPWLGEFWGDEPALGRQRVKLVLDEAGEGGSRRRALSNLTGSRLVALAEHVALDGGALVEVRDAQPASMRLGTPVGELVLECERSASAIEGRWSGGGYAGGFRWTREPDAAPLEDYPALLEEFVATLDEHFVHPARLATGEWRDALAGARERVAWVRDDFEFVGLVVLLVRTLGMPDVSTNCLRMAAKPGETDAEVEWIDDVAVVRFGAVQNGVGEIDAVFEEALDARAVVLDLRGSFGYDLTAARMLAWLVPESKPVGYMLGRQRADAGPLPPEQRDRLPVASGAYQFDLYRKLLARNGVTAGACESWSEDERVTGPLMVLVDERTSAAVEGAVEYLQHIDRGTVVGAETAGAAVDAELFPLSNGWVAVVPVAVWVTWEGRMLQGAGVVPDVRVEPEEALDVALELLASP